MESSRRSFFRNLSWLPILTSINPLALFGQSVKTETDTQRERLALQILRFINTAEHWHALDYGNYVSLKELKRSQAVTDLGQSENAEKIGQGRSLIQGLDFEASEIVPGWELHQHLSGDGQGYVALLRDTGPRRLGTFSTDQAGIIYRGEPIGSVFAEGQTSAADVPGAQPISATDKTTSRISKMLKTLASLSGTIALDCCDYDCCYCTQFPCCVPCDCQCFDYNPGGTRCWDCGCTECVWCCTIY